jgi:predicted transcriptional regulator
MTVTVKLDLALEERLRQRAAASGRTSSALIREALVNYLALPDDSAATSTALALGADLFGRHAGPVDLASKRKQAWVDAVDTKRPRMAR